MPVKLVFADLAAGSYSAQLEHWRCLVGARLPSIACERSGMLFPEHELHQLLLVGFRAQQLACDAAGPQDRDPVSAIQHLFHLVSDQDDRHTRRLAGC